MKKSRLLLIGFGCLLVCATVIMTFRARTPEVHEMIDFKNIAWYVERARVAYHAEDAIRAAYPNTVRVSTPDDTEVLYFLEVDPDRREQIITVRGTDNLDNALQDADYLRAEDSALGIPVHRGFDEDTRAVYADLLPHLNPDYDTYVTGHSLGAAISTLLMMYLHKDGYPVQRSVNFGQPKLTNKAGAKAFDQLPLMRVVDANDVVPLLPATTLLDSIHGVYTHFGEEVILLTGPHYVFLDQREAMRDSRGDFWHNLGHESMEAHHVDLYAQQVTDKESNSVEVPYKDREKYTPASEG